MGFVSQTAGRTLLVLKSSKGKGTPLMLGVHDSGRFNCIHGSGTVSHGSRKM